MKLIFSFCRIFVIELTAQVKYLLIRYETLLPLVICYILYIFFYCSNVLHCITEQEMDAIYDKLSPVVKDNGITYYQLKDVKTRYKFDPTLEVEDYNIQEKLIIKPVRTVILSPYAIFVSHTPSGYKIKSKYFRVFPPYSVFWLIILPQLELRNTTRYFDRVLGGEFLHHMDSCRIALTYVHDNWSILTSEQKMAYLNLLSARAKVSDSYRLSEKHLIEIKTLMDNVVERDVRNYDICRKLFDRQLESLLNDRQRKSRTTYNGKYEVQSLLYLIESNKKTSPITIVRDHELEKMFVPYGYDPNRVVDLTAPKPNIPQPKYKYTPLDEVD